MDEEHKPVTIAEVIAGARPCPRIAWPAAIAASWTPGCWPSRRGRVHDMGAIKRRLRCNRCGARFPRVGLQTPPRLTPYSREQ